MARYSAGMDTDTLRRALQARRDELQALSSDSAQSREAVALDQQSVGRLSRMDAMQQQAMAQATESRRREELRRVLLALRRMDAGDYGICDACGDDIAPGRLALDPASTLCVGCAEKQETR
mgnify:CR=1 FL=1